MILTGSPIGCNYPPYKKLEGLSQAEAKPKQLLYYHDKRWPSDKKQLQVYFIDTHDKTKNEKVLSIAKQWEEFVSLKFVESKSQNQSDIRITYDATDGSWSFIGIECQIVPQDKATMNLGALAKNPGEKQFQRTVLHEFGHALGFEHELQHPYDQIPWNEEAVLAYYRLSGWDDQTIFSNVLNRLDDKQGTLRGGKELDTSSIMCYSINLRFIKPELQARYKQQGYNCTLSLNDQFIARQAYPRPLSDFPIGCKVQINKENVIRQFQITRRQEEKILPYIQQHCGQKGVVKGVHPVMGVQVECENRDIIWFEPECMELQLGEDVSKFQKIDIPRLFVETVVEIEDNELNQQDIYLGAVKLSDYSIFKSQDGYNKILVEYGDSQKEYFDAQKLKIVPFFNKNVVQYINTDIDQFQVGQKVTISSQQDIELAMTRANRNFKIQDIQAYIGERVTVKDTHYTNGILVDCGKGLWLEPGCFKENGKPSISKQQRFFLLNEVVIQSEGEYKGKFGTVQFQNKDGNHDISVKLKDTSIIKDYKCSEIKLYFTSCRKQDFEQQGLEVGNPPSNPQEIKINTDYTQPIANSIQDTFVENLASQLFGIDIQNEILLPIEQPKSLQFLNENHSGKENKDYLMKLSLKDDAINIIGRYSARPQSNTLQSFYDIKEQLYCLYSLIQEPNKDTEMSQNDEKYFNQFEEQLLSGLFYDRFFSRNYAQSRSQIDQDNLSAIQSQIKETKESQKKTLNKYGDGSSINFLKKLFFRNDDEGTQIQPQNYKEILTQYNDAKYEQSFRKFKISMPLETSKRVTTPFMKIQKEEDDEYLTQTFQNIDIEGEIFEGQFVRPWFTEALFDLDNIVINTLSKGQLSNGKSFSQLQGQLSLIPQSFIVLKNVKMVLSQRDFSRERSIFDQQSTESIKVGPFIFESINISSKNKDNQAGKVIMKFEEPQLLGAICKKMNIFPIIGAPHPAHLFGLDFGSIFNTVSSFVGTAVDIGKQVLPVVANVASSVAPFIMALDEPELQDAPQIRIDLKKDQVYVEDVVNNAFQELKSINFSTMPILRPESHFYKYINDLMKVLKLSDEQLPIEKPSKFIKTKFSDDEMISIQESLEGLNFSKIKTGKKYKFHIQYFSVENAQGKDYSLKLILSQDIPKINFIFDGEQEITLISNSCIFWDKVEEINQSDIQRVALDTINIFLQKDNQQITTRQSVRRDDELYGPDNIIYTKTQLNSWKVTTSAQTTVTSSNIDTGTKTTKTIRDFKDAVLDACEGDDAGHLIAACLGGDGNYEHNIVPINSTLNQGKMKQAEVKIRNRIKNEKCTSIDVKLVLEYTDKIDDQSRISNRPSRIHYSAIDNNNKDVINVMWENSKH